MNGPSGFDETKKTIATAFSITWALGQFLRHPLAAAAIVALAGESANRDAVERAIRHNDYSKIHMSEFFFRSSCCPHPRVPPAKPWSET